jgi:hypothetical protein
MRHRRALLLLVFLALALTLVVVFEPGRERPPATVPLTTVDVTTLERLTIRRAGEPAIEIERRGGHWWLTAPWPAPVPALAYRIESTLGLLAARREHSQAVAGLDLSQFALDPPLLELEAGGEQLRFGNTHPINRQRHVQRAEELLRIADFHFSAIDVDAAEWVATAPLPPEVSPTRIELPGRVLVLERPAEATAAPELVWSGPTGDGELAPGAVASAWREARAWRVERLEDAEKSLPGAEASAHSDAAADPSGTTPEAPGEGRPGQGALDPSPTDAPSSGSSGALDPAGVRIGWDGGQLQFRILQREPELILARDDVGIAWAFAGPDARRLLGLAEVADTGGEAGGEAPAAPPATETPAATDPADPADPADPGTAGEDTP